MALLSRRLFKVMFDVFCKTTLLSRFASREAVILANGGRPRNRKRVVRGWLVKELFA